MTSKAFGLAQLGNAYADGALSNRNKIINGAMTIDQRNAGAAVTITTASAAQYLLDRWYLRAEAAAGSKVSVQRSSVAPAGFSNSQLITSLSAYAIGASEHFATVQAVEGFNAADLSWGTASAKTITVSFWVRSSLTGLFSGFILNGAANRCFVFSYTINAADTWEYKTITIPGDTTGTWVTDNGLGLYLNFTVAAGSSVSGAAGSWSSTFKRSATGQTSLVGTSGATFYITGVQLEAGDTATPFEHRSYGAELALCERYYLRQQGSTLYPFFCTGYLNSATRMFGIFNFPQKMRATPTLETGTVSNYQILSVTASPTCTGISLDGQTTNFSAFLVIDASAGGMTTGQGSIFRGNNTASAFVAYSAEL
jgi:hypothetical protein